MRTWDVLFSLSVFHFADSVRDSLSSSTMDESAIENEGFQRIQRDHSMNGVALSSF